MGRRTGQKVMDPAVLARRRERRRFERLRRRWVGVMLVLALVGASAGFVLLEWWWPTRWVRDRSMRQDLASVLVVQGTVAVARAAGLSDRGAVILFGAVVVGCAVGVAGVGVWLRRGADRRVVEKGEDASRRRGDSVR